MASNVEDAQAGSDVVSEPTYNLNRDAKESARLNQQHQAFTNLLGYLIHPSIPTNSPTLKIGDIGTGTGAWLLDVSKILPQTCTLSGFDISPLQFPTPSTTPPNVTFYTQSILTPFPQRHLSFYDIIAVRLLSIVLLSTEWEAALKNLLTLLKPGGYIQWIDGDFSDQGFTLIASPNATFMKQAREAHRLWMVKIGRMGGEPKRLVDLFKGEGLEVVEGQLVPTDRTGRSAEEFSRVSVPICLMAMEKGLGLSGEAVEEVERGLLREMMGGRNYFRYDIYVALGRKRGVFRGLVAEDWR